MLDHLHLLQILPDQYCRRNDVRQGDRNKKENAKETSKRQTQRRRHTRWKLKHNMKARMFRPYWLIPIMPRDWLNLARSWPSALRERESSQQEGNKSTTESHTHIAQRLQHTGLYLSCHESRLNLAVVTECPKRELTTRGKTKAQMPYTTKKQYGSWRHRPRKSI